MNNDLTTTPLIELVKKLNFIDDYTKDLEKAKEEILEELDRRFPGMREELEKGETKHYEI